MSIQAAFMFMRNLVSVSITQIILFSPFIIFNSYDQLHDDILSINKLCKGFLGLNLPCAFYYSRMNKHVAPFYSMTLILFAINRLRFQLNNFITFLSHDFRLNYEGEGNHLKVSQMLFNAWEFRIDNRVDQIALQDSSKLLITTEIYEQKILKIQKERSKREWIKLYVKRFFSITFSVGFIFFLAYVIIMTNTNKDKMIAYASDIVDQNSFIPN